MLGLVMVRARPLVDCVARLVGVFSGYFLTVLSVRTFTLLLGVACWVPWPSTTLQNIFIAQKEREMLSAFCFIYFLVDLLIPSLPESMICLGW